MLGPWSLGKTPVGLTLHVAFEVAKMDDPLKTSKWLKAHGITPLSFYGIESEEPSVIGWTPACRYLLPRSRWPPDRVSDNAKRKGAKT